MTFPKKNKDEEFVSLTEKCSFILQRKLPQKMKDSSSFSFVIPCYVGKLYISKAICDPGASINIIQLSMLKKIEGVKVKPSKMTLTLADMSTKYPYSVEEDYDCPLLLFRQFLATTIEMIDVELGELMLRPYNEQVSYNVFETMQFNGKDAQCYQIVVLEDLVGNLTQHESPDNCMKKTVVNSIIPRKLRCGKVEK